MDDQINDPPERGGRARLSQERSRARREQLIDAAATLFAEGGTKAITHRSVSEQAEMPLATVSYYFDSIDVLVDELIARTLQSWTARLASLRPAEGERLSASEAADRIGAILHGVEPVGYAYELRTYLTALRREHLLDEVHAMQGNAIEAVADLGRAVGLEDPYWAAVRLTMMIGGSLVAITDPETHSGNMAEILADMSRRVLEDAARLEG